MTYRFYTMYDHEVYKSEDSRAQISKSEMKKQEDQEKDVFKSSQEVNSADISPLSVITDISTPPEPNEVKSNYTKSRLFQTAGNFGSSASMSSKFKSQKSKFLIGSKRLQQLSAYLPSIGIFSIAGALVTMYLCEWKAVLEHVPFYGGKYKKEE